MIGGQKKTNFLQLYSFLLTFELATAAIANAAIPAINPNPGNASLTAPKPPSSSSITGIVLLITGNKTSTAESFWLE